MEKLKQAHGNWVEADRFWDREPDIKLMIEKLDQGRPHPARRAKAHGKNQLDERGEKTAR